MFRLQTRFWITISFCLLFFYLSKNWYQQATPSALTWLLWPTTKMVSWMSGMDYFFRPAEGFLRQDGAILIHKDCSGFNFLLIASLVVLTTSSHKRGKKQTCLFVFWGLLSAYLLTILANTARILCLIQQTTFPTLSVLSHKSIGIFVYLSFLITFSLILWSLQHERPQPSI